MATLTCQTLKHGDFALTIAPVAVMQAMTNPHQYDVALTQRGQVLHAERISVADLPERHFFVFILANAFRRCDLLVQRDLGYKLWTPSYEDPGYGQRETAYLRAEALDLEFVLSGLLAYRSKEPRLHGDLTLLPKSDSAHAGLAECRRLSFHAPIEAAREFGESLYRECAEAARLRSICFPGDAVNDPFRPPTPTVMLRQ